MIQNKDVVFMAVTNWDCHYYYADNSTVYCRYFVISYSGILPRPFSVLFWSILSSCLKKSARLARWTLSEVNMPEVSLLDINGAIYLGWLFLL